MNNIYGSSNYSYVPDGCTAVELATGACIMDFPIASKESNCGQETSDCDLTVLFSHYTPDSFTTAGELAVRTSVTDLPVSDIESNCSLETTGKSSNEQTMKYISELKTYDSALKVISSSFKLLGLKKEFDAVKKMRGLVKDVIAVKSIKNGESNYDLTDLYSTARDRKSVIGSFFAAASLGTNAMHYALDLMPASVEANIPYALGALGILDMTVSPLKLAYKLSSLDVAFRERWNCKGTAEELDLKNIILLKSGIEVTRELVKAGVMVTGASCSAIPIGLAAAGAVSGGIGLYVGYQACGNQKKTAKCEKELPV